MNITTGGPHTLLFERDQQLATLLSSELQLANYTNHTARTAVEVFDAIARYPVKLVLVNMAQAAAARREFWVALDSQRRDRKVQVLSFICSNLASYGSREYEETQQISADMEIDGMLGLMSLVEAVRTRVPSATVEASSNTQSRLPRMGTVNTTNTSPFSSSSSSSLSSLQRPSPSQPAGSSGTGFRSTLSNETGAHITQVHIPPKISSPVLPPTQAENSFSAPPASFSPATGSTSAQQPSYSEKIRAVLYPNQRAWNTQNTDSAAIIQDPQEPMMSQQPAQTQTQPAPQPQSQSLLQSYQNQTALNRSNAQNIQNVQNTQNAQAFQPRTIPSTEGNVLQRMASGQISDDVIGESGLAQLSRMARGFQSSAPTSEAPSRQQYNSFASTYNAPPVPPVQPVQTEQPAPANNNPWAIPAGASYASLEAGQSEQPDLNVPQFSPAVPPYTEQIQSAQPFTSGSTYSTLAAGPIPTRQEPQTTSGYWQAPDLQHPGEPPMAMHPPYSSQATTSPEEINVKAQMLRASPIQDMPIERTVTGPAITDTTKRSENHARTAAQALHAQQMPVQQANAASQQPAPPLASIAHPLPTSPASFANKTETAAQPIPPAPLVQPAQQNTGSFATPATPKEQKFSSKEAERLEAIEYIKERTQQTRDMLQKGLENARREEELDESMTTNNAVLLDIVQSLPPMPALAQQQQQSIQSQVLNGRATRSLNKVLLDGHLVPQDRLEVAQNIQRMLRGVDLNYQLGEILLMFKLLSPDQLLAASLVSYGLINTTQISALGRVRQELHAIGMEYDLENLLILFRILTPEQLREARSSLQS
ncbi:hypothetical protein ccbrp13_38420 [Ktedonobacteria bacterium brp13]|nr:hypothetical protein ccbrp13_38420 [Ktedonobacteria bacterium brp13]